MKDIKYRAWDKQNNRMVYDVQNTYDMQSGTVVDSKGEDIEDFLPRCFGELINNDEYDLMQYTGSCDKNEIKVYKGDLLRTPATNKYEEENYVAYEVFFHDNDAADGHIGFQINRTHYHGAICGTSYIPKFLPRNIKKMERIGNIYENKELL